MISTLTSPVSGTGIIPKRDSRPALQNGWAGPRDTYQPAQTDAGWLAQKDLRQLAQQTRAGNSTEPAPAPAPAPEPAPSPETAPTPEPAPAPAPAPVVSDQPPVENKPKKGLIEGLLDFTNSTAQVVIGGLSNVGIIINSLAGISNGLGVLGLLK